MFWMNETLIRFLLKRLPRIQTERRGSAQAAGKKAKEKRIRPETQRDSTSDADSKFFRDLRRWRRR